MRDYGYNYRLAMRLFALCPDWRTDSGTHYFPMGISDPIPGGQLVQAEILSPQQNEWEERKKVAFERTPSSNPLTLTNLPKPLGHTTYLLSQLCEPRKFRSRLLCPPCPSPPPPAPPPCPSPPRSPPPPPPFFPFAFSFCLSFCLQRP